MTPVRPALCAALASLVCTAAPAQSPPCLGPFQRAATTTTVADDAQLRWVTVSGANALARIDGSSPAGYVNIVEAFRELAPGGPWIATQAWPLAGARGPVALDGERAAIAREHPHFDVAVFERQPATGTWLQTFAVPLPSPPNFTEPRLSGASLVLPQPNFERIDIWRREASGAYTFEATIESPSALDQDFGAEVDLEGDRLVVSHDDSIYLYRRNAAGAWPMELRILPEPEFRFDWIRGPQIDDGRVIHHVRSSAGTSDGVGYWRLVTFPGGISAVFDGVLWELDLGNQFPGLLGPPTAHGTVIQSLAEPTCGTPDPAFTPWAVIGAGDRDRPVLDGYVCALAGFAGPGDGEALSYDGRTLAVAVPEKVGAPRNNVHFASLLGADLDRNRDCVEDSVEIAATPSLDRNGNGRLDSVEERGEEFCVPLAPNSVGNVATLRFIGTEQRFASDQLALADGLPPGAFGVLAVALAPVPLPAQPMGPSGVCLTGNVGRYVAAQAGPDGVATTLIPLIAIPMPYGLIQAYWNETWSWQLVYRDGNAPGATSAVAVTVR